METIHFILFMVLCLGVDRLSSQILRRRKRTWIIASYQIEEGYQGPYPYVLGTVEIEKNLTLFEIHGKGVDEDPKDLLKINKITGTITVQGPVDYEKYHEFVLVFEARDKQTKQLDTRLGIEIIIADANDNAPQFSLKSYEITISESTEQGTVLITISAEDADSGDNHLIDLRIVSVTPKPEALEFYLTQVSAEPGSGTISFKGCLDYEKAKNYTIIVEAKDRGKKKQLSSSCTVIVNIKDGNNHIPVIMQQTGPRTVKEGQENVLVSRLQTTDKDTKGSPAWRAIYQILGDTKHFRITTDPETNEGLLYVQKQLDFEEGSERKVNISVMNKIPYYTCEVVKRSMTGLWIVRTIKAANSITAAGVGSSSFLVTLTVEDVNEPPIFNERIKKIVCMENIKAGTYLATFTAKDPDVASANTIVYMKGKDPAGWVTVDARTGKITTSKIIDRESVFVEKSYYVVTIYAVDNGKPSMTGTATLSIHITDENDNTPSLAVTTIDMCQSDGPSWANITAIDLDEDPYGGPFTFKITGDANDEWKVEPLRGFSVNLVKESTVHSGYHEIFLELSDNQGKTAVRKLSVTVCNCLDTTRPNCHPRKSSASTLGGGAFFLIFVSLLLLAGLLLLALVVSCKKPNITLLPDECSLPDQSLMTSNTEKLGTDCEVTFDRLKRNGRSSQGQIIIPSVTQEVNSGTSTFQHKCHQQVVVDQCRKQIGGHIIICPSVPLEVKEGHSISQQILGQSSIGSRKYLDLEDISNHREILHQALNKMMHRLHAPGEELGDYAPHVYAEEGDAGIISELDAISIPDIYFDPDMNLDSRFSTLASICMPSESTAYSTITACVMGKPQPATLIQAESHTTKMNTQTFVAYR